VVAILFFAAAQTLTLRIADMDPASPAILHNGYSIYLRIHYRSDVPIQITAEPYSRGKPARGARMSGAPIHQPGEGDAFYHFDFSTSATVDTVRLAAMRGSTVLATDDVPVNFTWDGQAGAPQTTAEWVAPLRAEEQERQRLDFAADAARGVGSAGIGVLVPIVSVVAFGLMIASLAWPAWGIIRWRGVWRYAAMMPFAAAVLWALKVVYDVGADPSSHNLLPFEFLIGSILVGPYMLVVTIWKRLATR
jgi:hypothetical protein